MVNEVPLQAGLLPLLRQGHRQAGAGARTGGPPLPPHPAVPQRAGGGRGLGGREGGYRRWSQASQGKPRRRHLHHSRRCRPHGRPHRPPFQPTHDKCLRERPSVLDAVLGGALQHPGRAHISSIPVQVGAGDARCAHETGQVFNCPGPSSRGLRDEDGRRLYKGCVRDPHFRT